MLSPELSMYLSSLNMLSPDGVCYSFDHRANGYGRGEGVIVLVLKTLSTAIRDADNIRAIIRGAGSNQDGRTPGITQPSFISQENLIRQVYSSCNLGFESTRYVEAHGRWNSRRPSVRGCFLTKDTRNRYTDWRFDGDQSYWCRLQARPHAQRASLRVGYFINPCTPLANCGNSGSVKTNVGHLEGGSGLAGILKCILILEKGFIPPNALFEKLNIKINAKRNNVQVRIALAGGISPS